VPTPKGSGFGSDTDSAAGGRSGFLFLLGVAALLALAGLFVPRLTRTLQRFELSYAPQMLVPLIERPG
jgi:hypothetical protein